MSKSDTELKRAQRIILNLRKTADDPMPKECYKFSDLNVEKLSDIWCAMIDIYEECDDYAIEHKIGPYKEEDGIA